MSSDEHTTLAFDAATLARGWLAVAIASSTDPERPAPDRTVSIEAFTEGIRIAATDSYVLLHTFVPSVEFGGEEPGPDEAPIATAVAMDPHGRGKGFLGHALKLAREADKAGHPLPEVDVEFGVTDEAEDTGTLPGLEAVIVALDLPDQERLKLATYEGEYPNWRKIVAPFKAQTTKTIALAPEIVGRLSKLGKVQPGTVLGFEWQGAESAARVDLLDSFPRVGGLVMPCRWDFDSNEPRVDEKKSEDDSEGDE